MVTIPQLTTTSTLLLSALIATTRAQQRVLGHHYRFPDEQVYDIPIEIWNEAIRRPNATAVAHNVTGYNTTQPYPGSPLDEWTLSLSVVGNYTPSDSHYDSITGAELRYEAPRPIRNQTDESWPTGFEDGAWRLCGYVHLIDYDPDSDVDTACGTVLSDECLTSMRNLTDSGELCSSPFPEACSGELTNDATIITLGNSVIPTTEQLDVNVLRPGDLELYDDMISKVWAISLGIWGYENSEDRVPGLMRCMRPEARDGSRDLEDVIESAASQLSKGFAWSGLVAASMLMAMLV
ncbi:hypothetical protein B0I35DRAFT_434218 [Stachybotrys elegans]|uniref:Uncharacterized protein n=1 Tax=Stachybotrys elegans TaxID=80388 RepID=A0A8K0SNS7_9HYPO|nr:hypothetical protein B0I35DRAFT_434218 [Stachybotrys elegans]